MVLIIIFFTKLIFNSNLRPSRKLKCLKRLIQQQTKRPIFLSKDMNLHIAQSLNETANKINKIECSHHEIIIIALTTMTYQQHILFNQQWYSQRQWQQQRWLGIIICCCCVTVCYRRGHSHNCVSFILHPLWIGPRQRWWHWRWWQWPSQGDASVRSISETTASLFSIIAFILPQPIQQTSYYDKRSWR